MTTLSQSVTDKFVDDLFHVIDVDIPKSVILQAKRCILDYLGATFAGARMLEEKGNHLLNLLGSTQGDITVIGFNRKANIQNAVLMNGLSAHIAELDDGHRFGMIHPGAAIISALFPLAEREKLYGKNLLLGIIVGYEAALRIASAMQPQAYVAALALLLVLPPRLVLQDLK
jgi:2-methylcitrate dehydratase PrpD